MVNAENTIFNYASSSVAFCDVSESLRHVPQQINVIDTRDTWAQIGETGTLFASASKPAMEECFTYGPASLVYHAIDAILVDEVKGEPAARPAQRSKETPRQLFRKALAAREALIKKR